MGFVPAFRGVVVATLFYCVLLASAPWLTSAVGVALSAVAIVVLSILYFWTIKRLLVQDHPDSAAATMAEDAAEVDVPSTGGEGKTAIVVGGGISGLTTARLLLKAGFRVKLLEGRDKVGGNNEPYDDDGAKETHATTCVFTSPSQQPHYASLCREMDVPQTSHELETVDGAVVLDGKEIKVNMGGKDEVSTSMLSLVTTASWSAAGS